MCTRTFRRGVWGVGYALLAVFASHSASGQVLNESAKLLASDGAPWDWLGVSVALSADRAVIGAEGDDGDAGSAYVFVRNGTTWAQEAKLTACDDPKGCLFGVSVAISSDTIVVGADRQDVEGADSGAAHVFVRQNSAWVPQGRLTPSDAAAGDTFGYSVAISGDVIVVGSYQDSDAGSASGSAYVFTRDGDIWREQTKLTASDAAAGQCFGYAVGVTGQTIVVGAHEPFAAAPRFGSAYVFTWDGSTWSQRQKLSALEPLDDEQFGSSVSIAEGTVVVGARGRYEHPGEGRFYGSAAYIFVDDDLTWRQRAKLTPASPLAWDSFGYSVSVSGDTVLVGAFGHGDKDTLPGAAYMYRRPTYGWVDMTETAKLVPTDAAPVDEFGYSVSVNGGDAVIGAADDDDNGTNSGSAYVFNLVATPCGNGQLEPGEECDDGNTQSGDCCSSACEIEAAGTVCRPAIGICDVLETCTGASADCPPDSFISGVECRASTSPCDPAEACDGAAAHCPENIVVTQCTNGDGCCPEGCTDANDDDCPAGVQSGACCDEDTFGSCTITTAKECDCKKCVWHKLLTCEDIDCLHNPIPTVSEWGLVVLTLLLLTGAKIYFGRRQVGAA